MMRTARVLSAVLALVSLTTFADAKVKLKEACGTDLEKFCNNVKKHEGRKACLRTHAAELQPSCTELLKERDAAKAAKHQ